MSSDPRARSTSARLRSSSRCHVAAIAPRQSEGQLEGGWSRPAGWRGRPGPSWSRRHVGTRGLPAGRRTESPPPPADVQLAPGHALHAARSGCRVRAPSPSWGGPHGGSERFIRRGAAIVYTRPPAAAVRAGCAGAEPREGAAGGGGLVLPQPRPPGELVPHFKGRRHLGPYAPMSRRGCADSHAHTPGGPTATRLPVGSDPGVPPTEAGCA